MSANKHDVWITGIGLVSSLGEGPEAHWTQLSGPDIPSVSVDNQTFAPYPVHPLVELEYSAQIPKRGDQRQMGPWQRLGTYAAGLALADAAIAGNGDLLGSTNMIVAAGGGERDIDVDSAILKGLETHDNQEAYLNEMLMNELRPTLFLAQLSNLLAGNISIVHGVTGSSRTFMGEEMAGVSALEVAAKRISGGQGELFLVGGAYNAERPDMLLADALSRSLWRGEYRPVWSREDDGGLIGGSVGAFLVLEERQHAQARGAKPYGRLREVFSDRCGRQPGAALANAQSQFARVAGQLGPGPLAVISGASGVAGITSEELAFLQSLVQTGHIPALRASGSVLGHSMESQFPADVALAAIATSKGTFFAPFDETGIELPHEGPAERILVTCWGHWRGEGMAIVEAIGGG